MATKKGETKTTAAGWWRGFGDVRLDVVWPFFAV